MGLESRLGTTYLKKLSGCARKRDCSQSRKDNVRIIDWAAPQIPLPTYHVRPFVLRLALVFKSIVKGNQVLTVGASIDAGKRVKVSVKK